MSSLFVAIFSYLMGTISGSFLIGKHHFNMDIRQEGSGNAGTTNAIRVMGLKFGFLTFLIDFLKGSLTVYLVKYTLGPSYVYLSMFFCVLGHVFPFYMHFKGGKGVATTMGASLLIGFYPSLLGIIIWSIGALTTRLISLWSILLYCFLPFFYYFLEKGTFSKGQFSLLLLTCLLGLYRHKDNIKRLLRGEEKKLGG